MREESLIERTISSTEIYNGKVIKVSVDDIILPDGNKGKRELVKHSGGVVILAIDNDCVLLVKQYRYATKKLMFELPAGKLEKGEDPLQAAKRELLEETGYETKDIESLGYIYTTPGICDEKLYLYKANSLEYRGQNLDEGEFLSCSSYSIKDVKEMIKSGYIDDAKTICAFAKGLLL